jgi:dTDP-4-dehydrorhamnose reductase
LVIFKEAESLGLRVPKKVNSIETSDYPTLAVRPKFSVLDCSKIKDVFGIAPSNWKNEVKNVIKKST